MTNEKRAQLVNQLIEAGGRVVRVVDVYGEDMTQLRTEIWPHELEDTTFYLLEDGETPESFIRP